MIDFAPSQVAIYQALIAAPATYPVHDKVPQGAAFPYIVLGALSALRDEELGEDSIDASMTIHAWSRYAGKAEAYAILQFIRDRLADRAIGDAWACTEESADVFEDPSSTAASPLFHAFARYRVRAN